MTPLLRGKIVLLAAVALLLAPGGAWPEGPPPTSGGPIIDAHPVEAPETAPMVAPGPEPDLVLLYTGGVIGYIEPCG